MSVTVAEESNGKIRASNPVVALSIASLLAVIGAAISGVIWFTEPVDANSRAIIEVRGQLAVMQARHEAMVARLDSAEARWTADLAAIQAALRRIEDKIDQKADKGGGR